MNLKLDTLIAVALYIAIVLALHFVSQKFKGKALARWAKWLLKKITAGVMGADSPLK